MMKHTHKTRKKISDSLKEYYKSHHIVVKCIGCHKEFEKLKSITKKYCSEECKRMTQHSGKNNVNNIFDVSSRTKLKIIRRMSKESGCFHCGWNEEVCDLHHINGRKIDNPHSHKNLTLLCPNCHRLAHAKKIVRFVTLQSAWEDTWKKMYYG